MPPSTIAGRYVVERAVGHGGMGTVWLCRDEVLGRHVAVKEVGNMPGQSTSDVARALREARNSAALNHRNVVSVFDAVEDGDHNWLVMEYVPSRTLSEVVGEDGPLSPERAAWIGSQAADGLAAAHELGTMHRDVKPGNILVMSDDHVKITDFGIARNDRDAQLTRSGVVTGTPAYFAPELAKGEEPTTAADVWALGATLYAAVEGRLPYPDQTNAIALLTTIASGPPPRPERAGFLSEAIDRMMDRDPRTRWTMADAAHALHRLHEQHQTASTLGTVSLGAPLTDLPEHEPGPDPGVEAQPEMEADTEPVSQVTEATTDEPTEGYPAPVLAPAALSGPDSSAGEASGVSGDDDERRGAGRYVLVAAAVLLVALAAGGLYVLLGGDGGGNDEPRTSATAASTKGESDKSPDEGSSSQQESSSEETPDAEDTAGNGSAGSPSPSPGQFVKDYYAHLPNDTRAAWELLSPGMQAKVGSYGNYRGFWTTIDAVKIDDTAVDGNTVEVRLTYTKDGVTESETRRLQLEPTDAGLMIAGDQRV